ncbi:TetR/AcrR family transcriptional regulator [Chryseobacterium salipaludis]|uniref:TetR/AcrR family transcriptional regulator n=1 Tax=Chryseobacterium TaxID=59732 RepID=UPI001FF21C2B|nr:MULTISPECIES: TetR/AcrR family transcriptional regulator [Chryseobacterium]MCJ8498075.1 TetR/AcrR family transcriptional regulator [Chryseobacterium salipaludis]MCX3296726.1 TetR/AcrR family transcriptional regulator [Planobacterium sp. JC490]
MKYQFTIQMNEGLFLRNPEDTELGRKILKYSVELIYSLGFESFTFKKLAEVIGSTEAGIYRYFENKHKLLIYITAWYFGWISYQIHFQTNNIRNPKVKLHKIIHLLAAPIEDDQQTSYIDESLLHPVIVAEGSKAYLTKQVAENNKSEFFQPYKDLCTLIGSVILEYNPNYRFPKSLASTIVEIAHFQNFFMHNISSLTDFSKRNQESEIVEFLEDLVFASLG